MQGKKVIKIFPRNISLPSSWWGLGWGGQLMILRGAITQKTVT